ncbi:hypothetical protein SAMN04488032_101396 [Pacificibacter marinus]|uniref:Uncharacterized protein n=1 Tax=Pacificibacter marinus TaxID=658057 RepID=A0A1Y5RDG3_9RHOB|nr:hypothetical protein SAMN04488032_101396 [Pacificibacter marinus]SLN14553.1 hypothetical protein PAM7971_00251 [Pacificibacter marinus]
MNLFEAFILEEINHGVSILALYPPTDSNTLVRFITDNDKTKLDCIQFQIPEKKSCPHQNQLPEAFLRQCHSLA